ncbi:MAG: hypothetical protein ACI9QC_000759, partial [Oceanicoccus sp.]
MSTEEQEAYVRLFDSLASEDSSHSNQAIELIRALPQEFKKRILFRLYFELELKYSLEKSEITATSNWSNSILIRLYSLLLEYKDELPNPELSSMKFTPKGAV